MTARWTTLASGSGGNSSLLETAGGGLLIDVGIGVRTLASRLADAGTDWKSVRGVLLTHTHSDHWSETALARMLDLKIPLFCHAEHLRTLQLNSDVFESLQFAKLVRTFEAGREFSPVEGVQCRALPVPHDGGATFGFRIEGTADLFSPGWAIGYAADLGSWDAELPAGLADVDVLAVEFNHDVEMQRRSRRADWLIRRVLSDHGHLSNEQGAKFLGLVVEHSESPSRLRHVVQLHLSQECNTPALAVAAATRALARLNHRARVITAEQNCIGETIVLTRATREVREALRA